MLKGLVLLLQTIWQQIQTRRNEKIEQGDVIDVDGVGKSESGKDSKFIDYCMAIFLFGWFFFGNYWVNKILNNGSYRKKR